MLGLCSSVTLCHRQGVKHQVTYLLAIDWALTDKYNESGFDLSTLPYVPHSSVLSCLVGLLFCSCSRCFYAVFYMLSSCFQALCACSAVCHAPFKTTLHYILHTASLWHHWILISFAVKSIFVNTMLGCVTHVKIWTNHLKLQLNEERKKLANPFFSANLAWSLIAGHDSHLCGSAWNLGFYLKT